MTDNDIKKALECCTKGLECKSCPANPHKGNYGYCTGLLLKDTLDLINRIEAENERLKGISDNKTKELLRYNASIEELHKKLETAKAEAYKEFAELIHCHCQSIINHEWNKKVSPVSWADAYEQFDEEVDNLLKEMVGDSNG